MGLGDLLAKFEKGISRLVVGRSREPLRIQKYILDEVESKTEAMGRSRKTFPYNLLEVSLLARTEDERARLEAVFDRSRLEGLIEERLRRIGCEIPARLVVRVEVVEQGGPEWSEDLYHVEYRREQTGRDKTPSAARAPSPTGGQTAKLVITQGAAREKEFIINKAKINIGRMPEILDKDKRIIRRNDLVFPEHADPINLTVSRAHAHIKFEDKDGQYRLFDDQSAYGTRIFRDGTNIDVYSTNSRGNRIVPGDEIYFGQVCVRFEIGEDRGQEKEPEETAPKKRTGLETQAIGETKPISSE